MTHNVNAPRVWRIVPVVCVLLGALHGVGARAHSDEYFDTRPSAHGGQTRMAGPIHIELVIAGTTATLYITDHADQPQITAGGKARLRIEGLDTQVELAPAGDNRYTGTLPRVLAAGTPVVAFVQLAGSDAQTARFGSKPLPEHGDDGAHDHGHSHDDAHGHMHHGATHDDAHPAHGESHPHDE